MNWFTGVIEDRNDPQKMGRVKVRIFGLHTDDYDKVKANDLPWAHIVMPPTSASISGVGWSPTGLVEGSWVVGFFADGDNCQDPMVLGSIHGYPIQPNEAKKAFKDADGEYPRWFNDTDVSKVARQETWKNHVSYFARYKERITKIEKSTKPALKTVDATAVDESREHWNEPEPRHGAGGTYPYVHVFESESGIVREIDDSPNGSRIVEYHPAGTWYEVYPDGDRVSKVSGDNFEIILYDDNILVRGDRNVTIEGDARLLVKGDYVVEVMGDYDLKVHGNRNVKVALNDNTEIIGNFTMNVKEDYLSRIGKSQTLLVDVDKTENIGGTSTLTVAKKVDYIMLDTLSIFSNGAQSITTNSTAQFLSKDGLNIGSEAGAVIKCNSDMTYNVSGSLNMNAGPTFKVLAGKIELN